MHDTSFLFFAFGIGILRGVMDPPRCCLLAQIERCFGKKPFCSFVLLFGACLRALTLWLMETFKSRCKSLFNSRGCFGCFTKPSSIIGVDDPSEGLRHNSAFEMERGGVQSQRSISSNNASNLDPSSSTSHPSEFVNHGLLLWNQSRQQWLGDEKSEKHERLQELAISWNTIYESLHGDHKPFPRPIPLPEMIDFLVDVWEQEGLYN